MIDFFEMERSIEELAKSYPAQCATTWFKVSKIHKPSEEEYRNKVVEYMTIFEHLLATFPKTPETEKLKELVKKILSQEIQKVLNGNNKEVEKRYKHYVVNSPSLPLSCKIDDNNKDSQHEYLEKILSITESKLKRKKQENNNNKTIFEREIENSTIHSENKITLIEKRKRKKRITSS